MASTSNLAGASGSHQSGVVHIRSIVTEQGIMDRANMLDETSGARDEMVKFCDSRAAQQSDAAWKTLRALFMADSREELVQRLGFSKAEVASHVAEAVKRYSSNGVDQETAEIAAQNSSQVEEPTSPPSNVASDETGRSGEETPLVDGTPGTPPAVAEDFFSSMAAGTLRNPLLDKVVPHKDEFAASSAAATIGSAASSIRSEAIKDSNTFRIYPSNESDVDTLVTQALVLGDFDSAVDLCLASERFADAMVLAIRGGPELLQSTQKAYFARRTISLPFLRVFQSIVTEDLADIVQNADLSEWKVIFVVLCTFAKDSEFSSLAEQLGQRLYFKWQMLVRSDSPDTQANAKAARENATLCFLAARRLERVVSIWIDEMGEEEDGAETTKYTAHAQALQSFIEKVAVFKAATEYTDDDLKTSDGSSATVKPSTRTYKLAGLYDRYYEYADLLAMQGMLDVAAKYVQMTPSDYKGTGAAGFELDKARERLLNAANVKATTGTQGTKAEVPSHAARASVPHTTGSAALYNPPPSGISPLLSSFQPPASSIQPPASNFQSSSASTPYNPPQSSYSQQNMYAPVQNSSYGPMNGYGTHPSEHQSQGYGVPSQTYSVPPAFAPLAPPPRVNAANTEVPSVPASQRRDMPGWNDMPQVATPKRPASVTRDGAKPAPIMSPFPMTMDSAVGEGPAQPQGMAPPPQHRAGQPGMVPPPPRGGPRPPSAQAMASQATTSSQVPARPPPPSAVMPRQTMGRGGPPPGVLAGPPPSRVLSPLGPSGRVASPLSRQSAQGSRVLSPSGQAPPPPGSRFAGPPPPGRSPSVGQPAPASSQDATPISPASQSAKTSYREYPYIYFAEAY